MASRDSLAHTLVRTVITSAAASAASAAALMLLADREGRGALRQINATSHWLYGRAAARRTGADIAHTGLGFLTHHAATMFWSLLLEKALGPRRRTLPELAVSGGVTA